MRSHIRQSLIVVLFVGAGLTWAMVAMQAQGASKIQRGAEIAPVPLNMKGLNPALVREGSYIVNAQGGCNDCHTVPSYAVGGDPFAGEPLQINTDCYLAGGAQFGPFITSRNITPRANGLPANRTLEEFKRIFHEGKDYRNEPDGILQVMPWPVYGQMSDHEIEAIYEYLRAIPMINPRPDFCTAPPPPA